MGPFQIEEVKVVCQALVEQGHGVVIMDVDVFVFDGSPEPLDENVVQCPASSIHADADVIKDESIREYRGGELAALIGVEDFGFSDSEGIFQGQEAEIDRQSIGQPPRQDKPAEPVYHGNQVHKALWHMNIGDVRAPYLIGMVDGQPSQQVGINAVLGMGLAGVWAWVNGFNAHFSHQTLYPFTIYSVSQFFQFPGHTTRSIEGCFGVLHIDQTHQQQIFLAFLDWLIVIAGPGKSNQLALSAQANIGMPRIDQPTFFLN